MGATTATVKPTTSIEQIAAQLSFGAAATSLLLLAALHVVSPEFDPSWRMVSGYALGKYGWMLTLMFVSLALSCAALFVGIRSSVSTIAGKVGLACLLAAVVGIEQVGPDQAVDVVLVAAGAALGHECQRIGDGEGFVNRL